MKKIKILSIIFVALAVFSLGMASVNLKNVNKINEVDSYEFKELSIDLKQDIKIEYINADYQAMENGQVIVDAVDKDTQAPIPGCLAKITIPSTNEVFTATTDANGQAFFSGIPTGLIYVSIVSVPGEYTLSSQLTQNNQITVNDNEVPEVRFHVTKKTVSVFVTAKDNDEVLIPNVGFTLYNSSRTAIATAKSDSKGECTFGNLQPGLYYLKQTSVPAGYKINDYEFKLDLDSSIRVNSTVFHEAEDASLKLTIQEKGTLTPIQNVVVVLKNSNNIVIGQVTTGSDGVAKFNGLEGGKYIISITSAPSSYDLNESYEHIEIDVGAYTPTTGNIQLYKAGTTIPNLVIYAHDTENNPIEDVTFEVLDSDGYTVGLFRTGSDGNTTPTPLAKGKYYVSAVMVPDGYVLDETAREVNLEVNMKAGFTIAKAGSNIYELSFETVDNVTKAPIKNYGIKLMDEDGNTIDQKYTDDAGIVKFNVGSGVYNFVCFSTPAGYTEDQTIRQITVRDGNVGAKLNIAPIPKSATLTVCVKDEENNLIKDAKIRITDTKDESYTKEVLSDSNGNAVFSNIKLTKYKVEVVTCPLGYTDDGHIYTIDLVMDGKMDVAVIKTSGSKVLKGDLNRDGKVNSSDATIALQLFQDGQVTAEQFKIGDMDNNQKINSSDAAIILEYFQNSVIEYVQL